MPVNQDTAAISGHFIDETYRTLRIHCLGINPILSDYCDRFLLACVRERSIGNQHFEHTATCMKPLNYYQIRQDRDRVLGGLRWFRMGLPEPQPKPKCNRTCQVGCEPSSRWYRLGVGRGYFSGQNGILYSFWADSVFFRRVGVQIQTRDHSRKTFSISTEGKEGE